LVTVADPEAHDFPAAADYLELLIPATQVVTFVKQLKKAKAQIKKAKDILRASELPLLPKENMHVTANLKKFKNGKNYHHCY
jgi:hypothetical protein